MMIVSCHGPSSMDHAVNVAGGNGCRNGCRFSLFLEKCLHNVLGSPTSSSSPHQHPKAIHPFEHRLCSQAHQPVGTTGSTHNSMLIYGVGISKSDSRCDLGEEMAVRRTPIGIALRENSRKRACMVRFVDKILHHYTNCTHA